ncbi:SDR family NAD(P)-dependent oxidoreductase [Aurantibacter sp.]|uniref:SDR family NAD(P)-dependent oxidoreductase n=1 Tax=Aurantibacter sp. TaxID=2807103 RepID=UPI0032635274
MKRFENQIAVIVGGARGIGRAIAERIISEGGIVCVLDVLQTELDELIEQKAVQQAFAVDITNESLLAETIQNIIELHGRLDILINSAGIVGPTATKIENYSSIDFQKIVNINLNGAFNVTKAVIPQMVQQNYGRILHVASIGGKEGNPGMVGYTASKAGLMGLVKGVGKEYAETGITVNGLAPAVIATPMNKDTNPEMLKYMTSKIPMGRLGTVEEVASLVCWIVSKEATFNTGFIFDISGGRATF